MKILVISLFSKFFKYDGKFIRNPVIFAALFNYFTSIKSFWRINNTINNCK